MAIAMTDRLNKNEILDALTQPLDDLIVVDTIGSTNDALYEILKKSNNNKIAFLSEEQTAGKGRQGKTWHSPKHQNIYCSLSWRTNKVVGEIQDLSMKIGKALFNMLKTYGLDDKLFLKFPNDILYDQKKLLGILIETYTSPNKTTTVIIGVGFNVHTKDDIHTPINQPWTSLDQVTGTINDRNRIAALIISTIYKQLAT